MGNVCPVDDLVAACMPAVLKYRWNACQTDSLALLTLTMVCFTRPGVTQQLKCSPPYTLWHRVQGAALQHAKWLAETLLLQLQHPAPLAVHSFQHLLCREPQLQLALLSVNPSQT